MKFYFPEIKYFKINDNFKIIFVPLKSNIISASITINVGSIHEKHNELGLAHFFEHMIFKGTKTRSSNEIIELLDSIGAEYNASTSYEYTNYYISGNKQDTLLIVDLLFDLFLNPKFPEKDIENEIKVVIEEFKMNQDDDKRNTRNKLMELLYHDTAIKYSIPVIGKPEYIQNFNQKNLFSFYENNYKKSNTIFSLIGDFDIDIIISFIQKIFNNPILSWIPSFKQINNKLSINFYNSIQKPIYSIINNDKLNQFIVLLGFRSIDSYNKWSIVSILFSNILCNGMSSRLFKLLRIKLGLTYYQHAYETFYMTHGNYNINYGINPPDLLFSLEQVILELKNLINNGITENELIKSKKMFQTSVLLNLTSPTDYGHYIVNNIISEKKPKKINKLFQEIHKISIHHVNRFIKKIFIKSNLFLVINGINIDNDKIKDIINLL
jgi:predicted Zn-dependent peptidase